MKKISIIAIYDHKFIQEMWKLLFLGNETIELAGDSGTFDGGMEMIKLKKPDIVLLDINLQNKPGIDAVEDDLLQRRFIVGNNTYMFTYFHFGGV